MTENPYILEKEQGFEILNRGDHKTLYRYRGNDQSVLIPEFIDIIKDNAFDECSFITDVQIPQNLIEIGDSAFTGCSNLASLVIPKGIKKIGDDAFKGCWKLEIGIYYHHEPSPEPTIPEFGTKYINLLDKEDKRIGKLLNLRTEKRAPYKDFIIRLLSGRVIHLSEYDTLFSSSNDIIYNKCRVALSRLLYPLELEEKFKKEYILYLKNNAQFIIPRLIKQADIAPINLMAGLGAIPTESIDTWIDLAQELANLEILATLMDYKNKFRGEEPAFSLDPDLIASSGEWATQENLDGSLSINRYLSSQQTVTIPAVIKGKNVTKIEGRIGSLRISIFFPNIDMVTSITIEEGIEIIDECAFVMCQNLTSVDLPNSLVEIGRQAFWGCKNLSSLFIPESISIIAQDTFSECDELVINAPSGAYAIEYAKEHGIKYIEI